MSEQPYSSQLPHATHSTSDSPLRPKVEGLCCHCEAERVLKVGGDEQGRGDLAFTLQTPVETWGTLGLETIHPNNSERTRNMSSPWWAQ